LDRESIAGQTAFAVYLNPLEVFNVKVGFLIAAACALLASTTTQAQVAGSPPCVTGTLASYIALGSGGCMFESTLYRNFSYVVPGTAPISPQQILVIPSSGPSVATPYPGLTFYGPWSVPRDLSLTSIIGYSTVPFPPNASAGVLDTILNLDLGAASIGGIIGSVEVTETVTPANSTLAEQLQVYEICEEVCRQQKTDTAILVGLESRNFSLNVTLDGGTGGASLNYFTANETYGLPPQ
ncbi:MAG: hypothetical protein ACRD3S_06275, partial [Terracidiphilus sp.]